MNAERIFLHDISSPITTAQLSLENMALLLADRKSADTTECLKILNTSLSQLKRAGDMISARRQALAKDSEK